MKTRTEQRADGRCSLCSCPCGHLLFYRHSLSRPVVIKVSVRVTALRRKRCLVLVQVNSTCRQGDNYHLYNCPLFCTRQMGDYPRHCHKEFITRNYSYHCVLQGNRSNGGELIRVGVELKRLMMENVREI